jgi:general secretion pathway protein J
MSRRLRLYGQTKFLVRGFTLIEVMVAISIFAVLSLGAYQMLQTIIDSHDRVRQSSENVLQLNLALTIVKRDFNQFAPRPVRDRYGEPLASLVFEGDEFSVEFTRRGWNNPAGRLRSRLQRVAYSVDYDEKTLTRHFWEVLDRAEDSEPISKVILHNVTDFRATGFAGSEGDLEDDFDLDDVGDGVPVAVEVVISTEASGDIRRLFQLVEPFLVDGQAQGDRQEGEDLVGGENAAPNEERDGE